MEVTTTTTSSAVEVYTVCGHLLGMLDRDQRTIRTRCTSAVPQDNTCHHTQISTMTTVRHHRTHKNRRHSNYLRETLRRLKEVLIVGTYLLSIVCVPSALSAPTSRHIMTDRMNSIPKWLNPCGMSEGALQHDTVMDSSISKLDISRLIFSQANIALTKAVNFRDEYVQTVFGKDFNTHNEMFKSHRYSWLPDFNQIPKRLGEPTPIDHLQTLKMDEILLDVYEYLQIFAAALEQMVWDQEDEHGQFQDYFSGAEHNLRLVLCEIKESIIERNLTKRPDIRREIMTDDYRIMNKTDRNVRDWMIYRDYMNALEYVVHVFKHFESEMLENAS